MKEELQNHRRPEDPSALLGWHPSPPKDRLPTRHRKRPVSARSPGGSRRHGSDRRAGGEHGEPW